MQRLLAKDTSEPCALLIRKAEDTDTSERTERPTVRILITEQAEETNGAIYS